MSLDAKYLGLDVYKALWVMHAILSVPLASSGSHFSSLRTGVIGSERFISETSLAAVLKMVLIGARWHLGVPEKIAFP
mgnify:CR=1 FL=1